jgi:ABC-type dipeptide/oligopeptide/nickel transport system ATPase component
VILEIDRLSVGFVSGKTEVEAVRDVSLALEPGERSALVGESGCGKTVLAMAVLGLLPRNARIRGSVKFEGRELLSTPGILAVRGRSLAVCWSNAERYFDPVMTIGAQIAEAYSVHHPGENRAARIKALEWLERLGFENPEDAARKYPFQLSGGMNQRAMIAMSLINEPRLLLVDEPTRGLDDANRAHVIDELRSIEGASILVITHDLDFASGVADGFIVMKSGEIVDRGNFPEGFAGSSHPYTRRLAACAAFETGSGPEDGLPVPEGKEAR